MIKVFTSKSGNEQVLKSYDHLLKSWDIDKEEIDIDTTYGITHCIAAGTKSKPPLLMLHGVGDNSAVMWKMNAGKLAEYFYCVSPDTIGGPGKSIPNENFNKKDFNQVDWISQIADAFKFDKFYIIGVSNGAYMTYNYTAKESQRVIKAICLEGGMVTDPNIAIFGLLSMLFPEILLPTRNNLVRIMMKIARLDKDFIENNSEILDHMILCIKHHNRNAMSIHRIEKYVKAEGMAVKDKLYFLIGGNKLELIRDFIRTLEDGGYRYKIIEGAGHAINHEKPDIVNKEIVDFLLE